MDTWSYIERVREKHGGALCSDYRIAQILGVSKQAMSQYKAGREAEDEVAMKIANDLELPALLVIYNIKIADLRKKHRSPELLKVWVDAMALFESGYRTAKGPRPGLLIEATKKPARGGLRREAKKLVGARGFEPPTTTTPR